MEHNKKKIIRRLFHFFRARQVVGGLEISQDGVRYVRLDTTPAQFIAERFLPTTLVNGKIAEYTEFVEILKRLRAKISEAQKRKNRKRPANVIVTLGSFANVYSKVFILPPIEEGSLRDAMDLNLRMIAPGDPLLHYAGSEILGRERDTGKYEILGAFASKSLVDDIHKALHEAGFFTIAVEFKALALARLVREEMVGADPQKSYILFEMDASGFNFIVVRRSGFYFEYFNSWQDVQRDASEISNEEFRKAVQRGFSQVINFYGQQWGGSIDMILVSAGDLSEGVIQLVKENFSISASKFALVLPYEITWEWLTPVGSAIRALRLRKNDKGINFLGEEIANEFRRMHIQEFFKFWRIALPFMFLIIIGTLVGAKIFLDTTRTELRKERVLNLNNEEIAEIDNLQKKVELFNHAVELLSSVRSQIHPHADTLQQLDEFLTRYRIEVRRLRFGEKNNTVDLSGEAYNEASIRDFKQALETSQKFDMVTLPLSSIQELSNQQLAFTMTFSIISSNTE